MKKIFYIILPFFYLVSCFQCQAQFLPNGGLIDNNFIGGFSNCDIHSFNRFVSKRLIPNIVVSSSKDLISVLKSGGAGNVIYLKDDVIFDLTKYGTISLPRNTKLVSGRGVNKSKGALIVVKNYKIWPLFRTAGDNIEICGIRLQGPDSGIAHPSVLRKFNVRTYKEIDNLGRNKKVNTRELTYGLGNSKGIEVKHRNIVIRNCEMYFWSYSPVSIENGGSANVSFSYIHDNKRYGLGYGLVVNGGFVNSKANMFFNNRHAIAGSGISGSSYSFTYNIVYNSIERMGHSVDMHGGKDRRDGSNLAGDSIIVKNNLFYYLSGPVILIRGEPRYFARVSENKFISVHNKSNLSGGDIKVKQELFRTGVIKQLNSANKVDFKNNRFYSEY